MCFIRRARECVCVCVCVCLSVCLCGCVCAYMTVLGERLRCELRCALTTFDDDAVYHYIISLELYCSARALALAYR